MSVLENLIVENKVPEPAKSAIYHAMERSSRHIGILENLVENENVWNGPPQDVPGMIKEKIKKGLGPLKGDVDQAMERVRERIENKIREAENLSKQIENKLDRVENEVENKIGQLGKENGNKFGQS